MTRPLSGRIRRRSGSGLNVTRMCSPTSGGRRRHRPIRARIIASIGVRSYRWIIRSGRDTGRATDGTASARWSRPTSRRQGSSVRMRWIRAGWTPTRDSATIRASPAACSARIIRTIPTAVRRVRLREASKTAWACDLAIKRRIATTAAKFKQCHPRRGGRAQKAKPREISRIEKQSRMERRGI